MQEFYSSKLQLLLIVSGVVLLIACANIADLLLARGMNRKVEMSVRTALGAARTRIIRQLLTDGVVWAALGGAAGLGVAYLGARMLLALAFPGAQIPIPAGPSMPVLAFVSGLSLATAIVFGLAPAWIAAQAEPADALRSGTRTTSSGASLLQRGLVVLQAALSLVLVGAELVHRKPEQNVEHRSPTRFEKPLRRSHQSANRWIRANTTGSSVSNPGTAIPCLARHREGRHQLVHTHGRQQLYEVTGVGTPVLLTSMLTLVGAALLAGLIPARRAASTDPVRALRIE